MIYAYYQRYILIIFSSLVLLFSFSLGSLAQEADGAKLFQANCLQCHSVGKGVVIGPDLKDINKRHSEDWLIKWIKNSREIINSGDKYAVDLFNQYKVEMPAFALPDNEVKAILAYIKTESEKAPVVKTKDPIDGEKEAGSGTDWVMVLFFIAAVLLVIISILSKVKKALSKAVRERQGLPEPIELPTSQKIKLWIRGNKKLIAISLTILVLIGLKESWDALAGIGVSQGYQPEQPIAFSHKIHAGENGISCIYCHSGAEKSKTAGIPSAAVCMNCHKGIKEGTNTGTEEIAKIYKALDYDPATQTYGNNPKPIKWVRVHNLPDLAYFNHSQHVKVGGIECQTCHGKVEEMTVAMQHSKLTMGWCIDCHRNTEVKMADNHYYDRLHANLIKKYGKDAKFTVESIGGTECARCHY